MPLQLIGAGFGRTGTRSLKDALEMVGLDACYHMADVFARPEDAPVWSAAAAGEPVDWGALFAGYRAAVDWPACTFYRELMREYPDARVLLTVRDPDRWYESVAETIRPFSVGLAQEHPAMGEMHRRVVWDGTFQDRFEDREFAIEVFERHNAEVQAHVPADRLLVYRVQEGWEPLCAFLGVEVPDAPFPHLNDRETFLRRNRS